MREVALLDDPSEVHSSSSSSFLSPHLYSSPHTQQSSSSSSSAVRTVESLHTFERQRHEEEDKEDISLKSDSETVGRTRRRSFSSSSSAVVYPRARPGLEVDAVVIKVEEGYALLKLFCSSSSSSAAGQEDDDEETDGARDDEDSLTEESDDRSDFLHLVGREKKKTLSVSQAPVSSPSWGFLHWSAVDFSSPIERKEEGEDKEGREEERDGLGDPRRRGSRLEEISLPQDEEDEGRSSRKRHGRIDLRQVWRACSRA